MSYARRNRRVSLNCQALLIIDGESQVVDAADISELGISVVVPVRPKIGTRVVVQLDPQRWSDFPRLPGVVRSTRGMRVGIGFGVLTDAVRARLAELTTELARGTGSLPVHFVGAKASQEVRPQLAHSQTGRELLYQTAHERLRMGDLVRAREALLAAVAADPHNGEYRVLLYRIEAEEQLARGARGAAETAVARALALAPNDEDVKRLAARLTHNAPAPRSAAPPATVARVGLLSRLFGRD